MIAIAIHVDYASAFDSLSHIYLYYALKRAGTSAKTRQVYKAIYSKARILVKVYGEIAGPVKVGSGALEGDITSPIYFNVGLESVFRLADELNSAVTRLNGIRVKSRRSTSSDSHTMFGC